MNTNITGKYGNYVGEGIYSRSKNPDIYKIWMKILSKTDKDKSVVISSEWLNFQNFADWYYYNKIDLNPDVNYVIDTNILTWLSDSDQIIYSEDTCCLIPRQLYDSIKCCSLLYQRIYKSKLPVGVNFRGNLFEPTLGNRDNRKSLGLYKTPELAFYVYKYFKEQIIKEMADRFYSINALHEYVYECVYNLPIVSIQVSLDNYNPQEIESILEEKSKKPINPIQIFDYKKFHEGCIYNTKFGGPLIVLEYRDKFHVRIKFLDQAGYETIANIDNILSGNVKNPFALNKYGGYYGVGPYTSVQFMNVYKVWEGVLRRAAGYDNKCYDKVESPEQFYDCAVAFGNFQYMLRDFPAEKLYEIIPNFHNTPDRVRLFEEALEKDVSKRADGVKREIDFVLSRREFSRTLETARAEGILPLRVTHNDTKLNNILFDKKTGEPLCVIDLDTIMPGYSVNDFGDAIRFGATTAAEDECDLEKVNFDISLYELYVKGFLLGTSGELTECEIDLLPIGAIMMTYECGMRFLTDYLSGDTYFKTSRPGHNLDRARNQFKLVEDMEKELGNMRKIIEKYR